VVVHTLESRCWFGDVVRVDTVMDSFGYTVELSVHPMSFAVVLGPYLQSFYWDCVGAVSSTHR
jgi:hypothetical protein